MSHENGKMEDPLPLMDFHKGGVPMPGKTAKVQIMERPRVVREELRRSRSESRMISQRAKITLLAFQGRLNAEMAGEVDLERQPAG